MHVQHVVYGTLSVNLEPDITVFVGLEGKTRLLRGIHEAVQSPDKKVWNWGEIKPENPDVLKPLLLDVDRARDTGFYNEKSLNYLQQAVAKAGFQRGLTFFPTEEGVKVAFNASEDGQAHLRVIFTRIAEHLFSLFGDQNPLDGYALVLINELELLLHPKFQYNLLPKLKTTFPKVQFVVSTNSPLIISTVDARCLRIIEDEKVYSVGRYTYGRDANSLLIEVFGAPNRPVEIEKKIDNISRLIDRNKLEEAKKGLAELESIVGPHDSEVLRINTLLHFLEDDGESQT